MWNENAPLELLKEMPHVLTEDNLSKIQEVIDKDKYINSSELGGDLCGKYAPFCDGCDKTVHYPCAVAYVKMMHKKGMDVEIENVVLDGPIIETPTVAAAKEIQATSSVKKASGNKIRIAIARKKN